MSRHSLSKALIYSQNSCKTSTDIAVGVIGYDLSKRMVVGTHHLLPYENLSEA